MKDICEYIESGIIEAYVLGLATSEEITELESLVDSHPEITGAIKTFSDVIEQQAKLNAVAPDPIIKPMLMATIDFISRMENGEQPSFPPALSAQSAISDYQEWLNDPKMTAPDYFTDVYARIIATSPQMTTAIVWIKDLAPQEVHTNEYERFLIVEGTCDIIIENEAHHLVKGDFLSIPLYSTHSVKVTSNIACKAILQRVAVAA